MENKVNSFIHSVKKRLNNIFLYNNILRTVITCALCSSLLSLTFVLRGYRAPYLPIYFSIVIITSLFILFFINKKRTLNDATHYADHFYNLNDGLVSSIFLLNQKKSKTIHKLQIQDTVNKIENVSVNQIPFDLQFRNLFLSCLSIGVLLYLLSFEDSPEFIQQRLIAENNIEKSSQIKEELLKEVIAMKKDMDDEQKKWLKENKILKDIQDLKADPKLKESLKAYAKIEKKLRTLQKKFSTKADEKFLRSLADDLKKYSSTNRLGRELSKKDYKKAAKMLDNMKLKKSTKENMKSKKLTSLKKLKKSTSKLSKRKSSNSPLNKNISEFNDSMKELNQNFEDAESEMSEKGELGKMSDQQCSASTQKMNASLDKFGNKISQIDSKKSFAMKMGQMMNAFAQSNSKMLGKSPGKGIGSSPGNKSRKAPEPTKALSKNNSQLKGMLGAGKSTIEIEDTGSGYGISNIKSKQAQKQYQHTLESIVQREDIPEELKQGVKAYFNSIHSTKKESQN